jgi:hypothetical protein
MVNNCDRHSISEAAKGGCKQVGFEDVTLQLADTRARVELLEKLLLPFATYGVLSLPTNLPDDREVLPGVRALDVRASAAALGLHCRGEILVLGSTLRPPRP